MLELKTLARKKGDNLNHLRKTGMLPGVIYGTHIEDNILFSGNREEFATLINKDNLYARLIKLHVDDSEHVVILRDIAAHPVNNKLIHIDLQAVKDDEVVTLDIPIKLLNITQSVGIKLGGRLNHVQKFLKVKCKAKDIPGVPIELDITKVTVAEKVTVNDLEISKDDRFKILLQDKMPIVSIVGRRRLLDASAEEDSSSEE